MKVLARLAAAFSCATVAAVGLATPAAAEFVGSYEFTMGDDTATWTVVPCGHESPTPCAYVMQNGGDMAPWSADAHLYVGYWTIRVERPDVIICDDGEKFPARTTYSWDAVTNEGWVSARDTVCGSAPESLAAPFTLTRVGAAEVGPAAPAGAPADDLPAGLTEPAPAQNAPAETAPAEEEPAESGDPEAPAADEAPAEEAAGPPLAAEA